ncbi:MAG: type II secretion system F family protein [Deferribacterales bacterium]
MPTFTYTGVNKSGKKVKGVLEGDTKNSAVSKLMAEGVLVSEIRSVRDKKSFLSSFQFFSGKNAVPDIFFQLSLLLKSGIALVHALKVMAGSSARGRMRNVVMDVAGTVSEGKRFSEALSKYPDTFEEMYVNLIRTAEEVGRLPEVLMDIARFEEEKKKVKGKLTSALMYPMAVLIMGMGVVGFLLSYVVPKLEGIFAAAGSDIPASTKALIAISSVLQSYGVFIFILILASAVALRWYYRNNIKFRMKVDSRLLEIQFINHVLIARFAHVVAFQVSEGLPLTEALDNAAKVSWNRAFTVKVDAVAEKVRSGDRFSDAVRRVGGFTELFEAAAATGEQSGNVAELLERVSSFFGKKSEELTSRFVSVIEPLFIMFIGIIIGFIVISIMDPLFSLNTLVR